MSRPVPPPLPPSPARLPEMAATAEVPALSKGATATRPLDFLLVTSRADFNHSCRRFDDDCRQAAVDAEIVYIEDLPGITHGEKLASLHRLNADRHASGAVAPSTIKVVLLHGSVGVPPADDSLDRFRQECLSVNASDRPAGRVHMITVADGTLAFPTDLVDAALRATVIADGRPAPGFADTILFAACGSGLFRDAATTTGGSYVFGSGKKSVFTEDFAAGLQAVVMEQGQRKRQNAAPLSGRDCWNLMRNHSGEHVSLVDKGTVEVSKVLRTGHSEPGLAARSAGTGPAAHTRLSAQAIRTLFAKTDHGSAASLRQIIDRWGPAILSADHAAVIPGISLWSTAVGSARDAQEKALLLLSHTPDGCSQRVLSRECLKSLIGRQWTPLLVESFKRMAAIDPLPLTQEDFVIWLRSMPAQAEQLIKLCRRSRDLSESLGSYLAKVRREQARQLQPGVFGLPTFFDTLADKAEDRQRRTSAQ